LVFEPLLFGYLFFGYLIIRFQTIQTVFLLALVEAASSQQSEEIQHTTGTWHPDKNYCFAPNALQISYFLKNFVNLFWETCNK
jgi:hypothetical protein